MSVSKEDFQKKGFALGGRVLSDEQCDELCAVVENLVENRESLPEDKRPVSISSMGGMENPVWQIVDIFMASEAFRNLVHHPEITKDVADLADAKELRLWHDQIQYKPAHRGGRNFWHQDWPYWGILDRPSQVTAWVALDDADEDNGCMSMVEGSHHWGDQIELLHSWRDGDEEKGIDPAIFFDIPKQCELGEVKQAICKVPKGHVHFHHGLTWHGSHPNTSGRPRRAIALHYMTEQTHYVEEKEHLMKAYVSVKNGEKLSGEAFPLVFADSSPVLA
jgi:ectoine hydroxylase-related dioxygenase (phytanoyl-CoA dioxygenase family)